MQLKYFQVANLEPGPVSFNSLWSVVHGLWRANWILTIPRILVFPLVNIANQIRIFLINDYWFLFFLGDSILNYESVILSFQDLTVACLGDLKCQIYEYPKCWYYCLLRQGGEIGACLFTWLPFIKSTLSKEDLLKIGILSLSLFPFLPCISKFFFLYHNVNS